MTKNVTDLKSELDAGNSKVKALEVEAVALDAKAQELDVTKAQLSELQGKLSAVAEEKSALSATVAEKEEASKTAQDKVRTRVVNHIADVLLLTIQSRYLCLRRRLPMLKRRKRRWRARRSC